MTTSQIDLSVSQSLTLSPVICPNAEIATSKPVGHGPWVYPHPLGILRRRRNGLSMIQNKGFQQGALAPKEGQQLLVANYHGKQDGFLSSRAGKTHVAELNL